MIQTVVSSICQLFCLTSLYLSSSDVFHRIRLGLCVLGGYITFIVEKSHRGKGKAGLGQNRRVSSIPLVIPTALSTPPHIFPSSPPGPQPPVLPPIHFSMPPRFLCKEIFLYLPLFLSLQAQFRILDHASFTPRSYCICCSLTANFYPTLLTPLEAHPTPFHIFYLIPPWHTFGLLQMSVFSGRPPATLGHSLPLRKSSFYSSSSFSCSS